MEVTSEILPFFERDFESKPKLNNRSMYHIKYIKLELNVKNF